MSINKLKWKCNKCGDIVISDPFEHHKMDSCKCGESAVDLETYMCRIMGSYVKIGNLRRNFEEERLEKRWTTYGKKNRLKDKKIISVSEMSDGHIKSILKTELYFSERMKWLLKREVRKRK